MTQCCATMYEKEWVQELLGESMHPGGLDLTRRLWRKLPLAQSGVRIADVACGTGTTAVALAVEHGARVVAIDLGADNLRKTEARAALAGVAVQVECVVADAISLPLADDALDGLICECAVSTFADKAAVITEFARVVRPGGVVVISDMVVNAPLPSDLAGLLAPWTCVGDALPVEGYQRLFIDAGLRAICSADETPALQDLLLDLKRKLVLAAVGAASVQARNRLLRDPVGGMTAGLAELDLSVERARELLAESKAVVDDGTVQYARMCFSKGVPTLTAPKETSRCNPSSGCC
jgi:SAM-dependent methyltransferase